MWKMVFWNKKIKIDEVCSSKNVERETIYLIIFFIISQNEEYINFALPRVFLVNIEVKCDWGMIQKMIGIKDK